MDLTTVMVQQVTSNYLDILKVIFGGVISLVSIYVAILVYLIRRREPWGRALLEIFKLMETVEIRDIRGEIVYACSLNTAGEWTAPGHSAEKTCKAIDRWGAYMDMISHLYSSRQLNKISFFEMYGDVIIRSVYKLAPFANEQRLLRGEQFWLPYQLLAGEILQLWKQRVKKRLYPAIIRNSKNSGELTAEKVLANTEVRRFLSANGRKLL